MLPRRAKLITVVVLLVSFAITAVALEFVHRHGIDQPQSDQTELSKNSKQMEQANRACTICLLARHRVSSPPIGLFGVPISLHSSTLKILLFQNAGILHCSSISLRGPPAPLI